MQHVVFNLEVFTIRKIETHREVMSSKSNSIEVGKLGLFKPRLSGSKALDSHTDWH